MAAEGHLRGNSNTWNHLTMCQQMNFNSFKNKVPGELFVKQDLFLNNPQGMI